MKTILSAVIIFVLFIPSIFAQTPQIAWAKSCGGLKTDILIHSIKDHSGNIYSYGTYTDSMDADPTAGKFTLIANDTFPVSFIQKVDSNGNFIWAQTSKNSISTIAVDFNNNLIVVNSIGVVEKRNSVGNLIWNKTFGAKINYVTTDLQNNIISTGMFDGPTYFDPANHQNIISPPMHAFSTAYAENAFVHKLDSNGNFVWVKTFGSDFTSWGSQVVTDDNNNIYTTGMFNDTCDFDPGIGVFNLVDFGHQILWDIFIQKLDANGNFVWAKSIGSSGVEHPYDLRIDKKNNVYIFGDHSGVFDADPNPLGTYFLSNFYGKFIEKIDSSGNLKWVKEIELSCFDIDENANFTYVLKWVQSSTPQDTLMLFSIDSIGIVKTEIMPLTNRGDSSSTYSSNISQILFYKNYFIVTGNFNLLFTIDSTTNCGVTSEGDLDIMIAKIVDCNVLPTSNYTIASDPILAHNWLTANSSTNASSYLWHWDDGSQTTSGMNAQHTYASPNNYNICLTAIASNGCHSTYCDSSTYIYRMKNGKSMISVNRFPEGTNAINKKYQFEIYPNPTNKQLIIDSKISINNLEITDLSGKILVNRSNPNSNIINVENLNNGIYFLKITTQNQEILQVKFVKE